MFYPQMTHDQSSDGLRQGGATFTGPAVVYYGCLVAFILLTEAVFPYHSHQIIKVLKVQRA